MVNHEVGDQEQFHYTWIQDAVLIERLELGPPIMSRAILQKCVLSPYLVRISHVDLDMFHFRLLSTGSFLLPLPGYLTKMNRQGMQIAHVKI